MDLKIMDRLEKTFMEYTKKYDENIKNLIKERGIEISLDELNEVLHDAKNIVNKRS